MSIVVKNLTKIYKNRRVLNNISFEIKSGEIVGLLGINGAGKSTLMKIISCFIEQDHGEVKINSLDNKQNKIKIKKQIGYLSEKNPLYEYMYTDEYMNYISRIHKIEDSKKRIKEILSILKIDKEKNKKIKLLSKGYKQRIGLAKTILHNPKILLLDEPASGLDPNQLIEVREIIKRNHKKRTTIISTHMLNEVKEICSRCIIIHKGEIVKDIELQKTNNNLENIFKKLIN